MWMFYNLGVRILVSVLKESSFFFPSLVAIWILQKLAQEKESFRVFFKTGGKKKVERAQKNLRFKSTWAGECLYMWCFILFCFPHIHYKVINTRSFLKSLYVTDFSSILSTLQFCSYDHSKLRQSQQGTLCHSDNMMIETGSGGIDKKCSWTVSFWTYLIAIKKSLVANTELKF